MKARIPADVDMPDRIFAGLTLRQIAIAGVDVLAIWGLFFALDRSLPVWAIGVLAAPVAAVGLALVAAHPSGMPAEKFVAFALGHLVGSLGGRPGAPSSFASGRPVGTNAESAKRSESGQFLAPAKRASRAEGSAPRKRLGSAGGSRKRKESRKSFASAGRSRKRPGRPSGKDRTKRSVHRRRRVRRERLRAPVVSGNGALGLGSAGTAAICRASSLNFALRSDAEKRVLTAGFARVLNSLDGPAQFVIHSEPADADQLISSLERQAAALPNPALATAAFEYADFLRSITSQGDVLTSNVFVCLREPRTGSQATSRLSRRVDDVSSLVRQLGVSIDQLRPDEASELIANASCAVLEPQPLPADCDIAAPVDQEDFAK